MGLPTFFKEFAKTLKKLGQSELEVKNMKTSAIILAAGKGTRMKSDLPKVLHPVCGKPMVVHIIEKLRNIGVDNIVVVVGHKAEMVQEVIGDSVNYALQTEQKGTGHAVMMAAPKLPKEGRTLVITGDTPLIKESTILAMISNHYDKENKGTVLTTTFENPTGYGRIIRDINDNVCGIVEEKDANQTTKQIKEVNTGIFCFDNKELISGLPRLTNNNAQNEYYLTDMVSIFAEDGHKFGSFSISDNEQVMGINDQEQLLAAQIIMSRDNLSVDAQNEQQQA